MIPIQPDTWNESGAASEPFTLGESGADVLMESSEPSETVETVEIQSADSLALLTSIDASLQLILGFIVFFVIVLLLRYIYRFLDMFC